MDVLGGAARPHQSGPAQNRQMLRHRRLPAAEALFELVHRFFAIEQLA
jgi:hypothetical protein